ncbi:hypothetical protein KEM55_006419 [Ascosphaera atra]|nr:hypothetical protein KEM55_006419 [Ascosphaera atra]
MVELGKLAGSDPTMASEEGQRTRPPNEATAQSTSQPAETQISPPEPAHQRPPAMAEPPDYAKQEQLYRPNQAQAAQGQQVQSLIPLSETADYAPPPLPATQEANSSAPEPSGEAPPPTYVDTLMQDVKKLPQRPAETRCPWCKKKITTISFPTDGMASA